MISKPSIHFRLFIFNFITFLGLIAWFVTKNYLIFTFFLFLGLFGVYFISISCILIINNNRLIVKKYFWFKIDYKGSDYTFKIINDSSNEFSYYKLVIELPLKNISLDCFFSKKLLSYLDSNYQVNYVNTTYKKTKQYFSNILISNILFFVFLCFGFYRFLYSYIIN